MMTNFQRTREWLKAYGKTHCVGDLSVAIGVHLEEISEFLRTISTDKDGYAKMLSQVIENLEWFAGRLKSGQSIAYIEPSKRVDALDALCDCEVAGNGVAFLAGFDKDEADQRVLSSNEKKLVDGKPIIEPGGKIGKPAGWIPPKLDDLV